MNTLDILAILAYFVVVIGAGFWYRKRASASLDDYFLGGKRLHWLALAMSGSVSTFDITGTMWMVSVLLLLGMRSWWHHWMWGVALPAFALAFMARWVRRSNVMTAAEWMRTRFGTDRGALVARYASAVMSIIYTVAVIGYAFQGIGKFSAEYIDLEPIRAYIPVGADWILAHQEAVLAVAVFTITTVYVVVGGLYSVVLTDVIQTIILTLAGILIAGLAYFHLSPEIIQQHVPDGFTRVAPTWRMPEMATTAHPELEFFGLFVIVWVLKGFLMNAGGPGQLYDFQRYLATKDPREASKVAAAWPLFLIVRWGMVMGIALLAMTGALTTTDPERVMPEVLQRYLPAGVRGVVIAGLLAAFMSTFSSTVNVGASFIIKDLWQPLVAPRADERTLIRYSYLGTIGLVVAGVLVGFNARSISDIWNWIQMALVAGVIVPGVLRWYWWRLNGWGYGAGVLGGILLSVVAPLAPGLTDYEVFPIICLGSVVGCIVGSYGSAPTDMDALAKFYRVVRPFGAWGPVRRYLSTVAPDLQSDPRREAGENVWRSLFNLLVAVVGLTALYLTPWFLVGHWHTRALVGLGITAVSVGILVKTWYPYLPPPGNEGE